MSIKKFNAEGYFDPTAYEALKKIEAEEKKQEYRPLVFICSPFAGETDKNISRAQFYSRFAVRKKYIPFAPHLLFPQFMDDDDKEQRELALFMGTVLMTKCKEVWVFGSWISPGMAVEIEKAKNRNMLIRYFNDSCEEVRPL